MKRKVLILGFLMGLSVNIVYPQIVGTFTYENSYFYKGKINEARYVINLYLSGTYEILINKMLTEDQIISFFISYGKYKINGNKLLFQDNYNGFKMHFYYLNNCVIAKEAPLWLLNKEFIRDKYLYIDSFENKDNLHIRTLEQTKKNLLENNQKYHDLKLGNYKPVLDFKLSISENNKYQIVLYGIKLSEGSWLRRNNELILTDKVMNYPFYAIIDQFCIYGIFFPGDFPCLKFIP